MSETAVRAALACFQPITYRKKEHLLTPGMDGAFLCLIEEGCLRAYTYDRNNREFNIHLAQNGQWMADMDSFLQQKPSKMSIEAVTRSIVWHAKREDINALLADVPQLKDFFMQVSIGAISGLQERILSAVTLTAKEHYRELSNQQPDLIRKVPQYHLASYLGITPESLSRIRKELVLEEL